MLDLLEGILSEFAERARVRHYDESVARNLEPEHLRATYRARHEAVGLCRSCTRDAKPGRKYCPVHLARANARATASAERARRAA